MSIATRRGDRGETDLLFGRRLSKTDIRVEAGGALDELNAALGLARAAGAAKPEVVEVIASVQADLVIVMGEVATAPEDLERYVTAGFRRVDGEMVGVLDAKVSEFEGESGVRFEKWEVPGAARDSCGAGLDFARTVCRRAERRVLSLAEGVEGWNPEIGRYLNRLSDVLWLLARVQER